MYSKHRLEALSDGIFAIAMTLLVLELKVPQTPHGQLWAALKAQSGSWISFVISFGIAARFWTLQHAVFEAIDSVHHQALKSTFLFLGLVSILPFTASLWGHNLAEPLAYFLYALNQLLTAVALLVKLEISAYKQCLKPGAQIDQLRFRLWHMVLVMASAVATASFLPSKYFGYPPLIVGAVGDRVRKIYLHRQLAKAAK